MVQTNANYVSILKEWYTDQRVAMLVLQNSPGLAYLTKEQRGGKYQPLPIVHGFTAGHSATFATAQANKGQLTNTAFQITGSKLYSLASIDGQTFLDSQKDIGAFLPAAKGNIDGAFGQASRDLAIHLYRDGSGYRGQVAAFAAGVITLTQPFDAVNFSIGDKLRFSVSKTPVPLTTPDTATVFTITAINISLGLLTGTVDTAPNPTVGAFIFNDGDLNLVMKGMQAWFPSTAPTAGDNFFNVDRSVNTTMLAGVVSSGSGKPRYEALLDAQMQVDTIGGGRPNIAIMHPSDLTALVKEMEATVTRFDKISKDVNVRADSTAVVGFKGIAVQGNVGTIECFGDRFHPVNEAHLLETSTCSISHSGSMMLDMVGRTSDEGLLLEPSADGYEVRVRGYPQFQSAAPGHNAVITNFGL